MAKPTLYKKKSLQDIKSRPTSQFTADEITEVNSTIDRFFELFKTKHLT